MRISDWSSDVCSSDLLALCWVDLGETNRSRSATFAAQLRSYPELFRSRRFWGYSLCMAFSIGAFSIFLGGAPLVAAAQIELSPVALGAAMGSTTAGLVLRRLLAGRFAATLALHPLIISGRLVP